MLLDYKYSNSIINLLVFSLNHNKNDIIDADIAMKKLSNDKLNKIVGLLTFIEIIDIMGIIAEARATLKITSNGRSFISNFKIKKTISNNIPNRVKIIILF